MKISSFSDDPTITETSKDLRVLHYLGSKLRMLQPIRRAVADVLRPGRACLRHFRRIGSSLAWSEPGLGGNRG